MQIKHQNHASRPLDLIMREIKKIDADAAFLRIKRDNLVKELNALHQKIADSISQVA